MAASEPLPASAYPPEGIPLLDLLRLDRGEFNHLNDISIAAYTTLRPRPNLGPGTYDIRKGLGLTSPRVTCPSWAKDSPRLAQRRKSDEEREHDERETLRRNLAAYRTLFIGGAVTGTDSRLPRCYHATESFAAKQSIATEERKKLERRKRDEKKKLVAAQRDAAAAAEAADGATPRASTDAAAAGTLPPRSPRATQQQQQQHAADRHPSDSDDAQATVITPAIRDASIRKTLSRPSSASVKYSGGGHWCDGSITQCAVPGVTRRMHNPRDGKCDVFYNIDKAVAATTPAPPGVAFGSSPRFPGGPRPPSAVRPSSARNAAVEPPKSPRAV